MNALRPRTADEREPKREPAAQELESNMKKPWSGVANIAVSNITPWLFTDTEPFSLLF